MFRLPLLLLLPLRPLLLLQRGRGKRRQYVVCVMLQQMVRSARRVLPLPDRLCRWSCWMPAVAAAVAVVAAAAAMRDSEIRQAFAELHKGGEAVLLFTLPRRLPRCSCCCRCWSCAVAAALLPQQAADAQLNEKGGNYIKPQETRYETRQGEATAAAPAGLMHSSGGWQCCSKSVWRQQKAGAPWQQTQRM